MIAIHRWGANHEEDPIPASGRRGIHVARGFHHRLQVTPQLPCENGDIKPVKWGSTGIYTIIIWGDNGDFTVSNWFKMSSQLGLRWIFYT